MNYFPTRVEEFHTDGGRVDYLYDLETTDHRIVVLGEANAHLVFTDFTEVNDTSGEVEAHELALLNAALHFASTLASAA